MLFNIGFVGKTFISKFSLVKDMVEILCPHCEGEIELDDDASGEFECPLCEGEFEWNVPAVPKKAKSTTSGLSFGQMVNHPIQYFGFGFTIVMLVILIMSLSATYYTVEIESIEVNFRLDDYEYASKGLSIDSDYSEENWLFEDGKLEGWGTAGFLAKMMFILALIVCVGSVVSRVLNALESAEVIDLPDNIFAINYNIAKFSSFVISVLMIVGILLFMIISPSASTMGFNQEGFDYGYTFFTWLILILPILYGIFAKLELDYL